MAQALGFDDEKKENNAGLEVLWCDSDPRIRRSAYLILQCGFKLKTFNETADCLAYLGSLDSNEKGRIKAIITSGMKRGGRAEKGLLNGLQMLDKLRREWDNSMSPVLAVVTTGALQADECAERGIKIIASTKEVKVPVRRFVQEQVLGILGSFGAKSRELRYAFSSKPQASCKENMENCLKFLHSIINKETFKKFQDPFGNHCFCSKCATQRIWYRGKPAEKYVLPIGWYRFGIKMRPDMEKGRLKMESWPVAFHGAPTYVTESIMEHRRIMFPGDKLNNGTILPVRLAACHAKQVAKDGKVIYISPTINYAGHPNYARPKKWKGGLCGQVVFQCRVKPKSYKKFKETMTGFDGKGTIYDKDISNNEVEWVTADRVGVAPYAVLIKLSPAGNFGGKFKRFVD